MDITSRDLHYYHLARLLHLVPHLHRVYAENCFLIPLFFPCVSSSTKKHVKQILLCLHRRFGPKCTLEVYHNILSFLSFPELITELSTPLPSPLLRSDFIQQQKQQCEESLLLSGSKKRSREEIERSISKESSHQIPLTSGIFTRIRTSTSITEEEGNEEERQVEPLVLPEMKAIRNSSLVNNSVTSSVEGENLSVTSLVFLVRPPLSLLSKGSSTMTTHLFVRMVSEYPLNEETMNTYFGRYGQVSCTLLQQRLIQDEKRQNDNIHYIQDFIVTVDSTHNALQAVRYAYYRELTFIALHNPSYNIYNLTDVDRILNEVSINFIKSSHNKQQQQEQEEQELQLEQKQQQQRHNIMKTDAALSSSFSSLSFIPDIVVDGLPYWLTVDQLRASFSEYGTVKDVRISIDDRSGAFTGAALIRMSTLQEALTASEELNGFNFKGCILVSGVLDDRLNIVSLRHGNIIRKADEVIPEDCDITENGRRWV